MVLQGGPCGRVGRRRTNCGESPAPDSSESRCGAFSRLWGIWGDVCGPMRARARTVRTPVHPSARLTVGSGGIVGTFPTGGPRVEVQETRVQTDRVLTIP